MTSLLHKKQCRTLLIAMHLPAKNIHIQEISRAVDAQKNKFHYDRIGPTTIIPPYTLYRSQYKN